MINILDWGADITAGLYRISLTIDSAIYNLVDAIYKIFLILSDFSIFSSTDLKEFVLRMYNILGVVMLFVLAYSLLVSLVNPDDLTKGKNSPLKIIFNVILTLVLIEIIPVVFQFATKIQSAILTDNTIGNIVIGYDPVGSDRTASEIINDGGRTISTSIFKAFFHPNSIYCQNINEEEAAKQAEADNKTPGCTVAYYEDSETDVLDITYGQLWDNIKLGSNFTILKLLSHDIGDDQDSKYVYMPFVSQIIGLLAAWMLVTYSVSLGLRAVKLSFYQLIAPIPIISRLIPNKNDIFNKWVKATLSTFFEVFIRVAVLFFVILVVTIVADKIGEFSLVVNTKNADELKELYGMNYLLLKSNTTRNFVLVFLIVGLLQFAKQAPQLIGDLFGIDSKKAGMGLLGAAALAGGITGFIGGGLGSRRNGGSFWAGAASGAIGGFQAKGNQWKAQATKQYQNITGDYKGTAGIFGRKSMTSRINSYAAGRNDYSKKKAAGARTHRANDLAEAIREGNAYEKGVSVLMPRMEEFEQSTTYKTAARQAAVDFEKDEKLKKLAQTKYDAWLAVNSGATEDQKTTAYSRIRENLRRERTEKILRDQNKGYKNEHTDVAHYLRDVDTRKKLMEATSPSLSKEKREKYLESLKAENASKVERLSKRVERDSQVSDSLIKKKEQDDMVKALTEAMKKSGLDKKDNK